MLRPLNAFFKGFLFHVRGIHFGLQNGAFLLLSVFPFFVTTVLYVFGFYLFTLYLDDLLDVIWKFDPSRSPEYMNWLHHAYCYVLTALLGLVLLIIMLYLFIVLSNIIASPFYDYVSTKYQTLYHFRPGQRTGAPSRLGILRVIREEIKKAIFMLLIPLPLLFLPAVGTLLAFLLASVFIAWDYVDYSLSRDSPLLRDRIRAVWRYKFYFLGFGFPLVIPLFNLMIIPFAVLGATKLYYDELRKYEVADPGLS